MKAFVLALSLVLAAVWPSLAEPAADTNTTHILSTLREKYHLPALALVVVKHGQIVDRGAVGVRKAGDPTPITTNDIFHIGSCTKSMTATLAAMFIEEGRLGWNTTIAEVFPELKDTMDAHYQSVTVEQLLQHRGGVPHDAPTQAWQRAWQAQGTATQQRYEFIRSVLALPPAAAPGTKMIYSNQGYAIVGAMLERIAGKPWEDLITEKLFQPLHMTTAGFGAPGTVGQTDQPWGHDRSSNGPVATQVDNPAAIGPGGTVHCSLDDLARFTIAHMEGERQGGLLKPETFRRLHAPAAGGDYACGWVCADRGWADGRALTHTGSNTKWYVVMWLAPKKDFSVVVGSNIGPEAAAQACDEAASAMLQKWLD